MKTKIGLAGALGAVAALLISLAARAQSGDSFAITESTIDAGGGTSTGGSFAISGTAGQPDAGVMSGGNFAVEGGFWHGIQSVQIASDPLLKIRIVGGNAIISWPLNTTGYQLQTCANLNSPEWTMEPATVVNTADEHTVTLSTGGAPRFYRLMK